MGFLHHVRKMMAIIARQRRPQDDQIERIPSKELFNALAVFGGGDMMPGFFDRSGLRRKNVRVPFAIQNLEFGF
jgi:hypothetical protein